MDNSTNVGFLLYSLIVANENARPTDLYHVRTPIYSPAYISLQRGAKDLKADVLNDILRTTQ
jgi:hypothetical protein